MKVILNQDIKGIGKKLHIVEVSEGYARNYLLPKKLAKIVDNTSLNEAKTKTEAMQFKKETDHKEAVILKEKLEKNPLEFKRKLGSNGKLFGSVTEKEIAEEIEKIHKEKVNKKKITLDTPVKQIGMYNASIKLNEGVVAKIKISVLEM